VTIAHNIIQSILLVPLATIEVQHPYPSTGLINTPISVPDLHSVVSTHIHESPLL
jgi:hypothetical protein